MKPSVHKIALLVILGLSISSVPQFAFAKLKVIATTTSMEMLVKEIGGDQVSVEALAAPDRDTHYLQAKPSMLLKLRSADLVVSVGAALEIGWLPSGIRNSANPKIQPGELGYFAAADGLELIEKSVADRSKGDVHPEGNPHFNLDPVRMAIVAKHLSERMIALAPKQEKLFKSNSEKLISNLNALLPELKQITQQAPGVVLMHKSASYLLEQLAIPFLGQMEPVPGVPPTALHIKKLATELSGKKGVIIYAPYHADSAAISLAKALNWNRYKLPLEPRKSAVFQDYRQLLLDWAKAFANV
ncbi:MAG: zinc ABC transporter substrate-binding protein [Pseudomonadales bacterium]|nr:zinc ABC transporter substrate-binding protein [Pseudomonadales bacterium]